MELKVTLLNFQQLKVLVRQFNKEDLPILKAMHDKRGLKLDPYLPRLGGIAFVGEEPIAIAFLRGVEGGGISIWDGLITDPDFDAEYRDRALNALIIFLIRTSKSYGMTRIISWAQDTNTIERAQKLGFKTINATLMAGDF